MPNHPSSHCTALFYRGSSKSTKASIPAGTPTSYIGPFSFQQELWILHIYANRRTPQGAFGYNMNAATISSTFMREASRWHVLFLTRSNYYIHLSLLQSLTTHVSRFTINFRTHPNFTTSHILNLITRGLTVSQRRNFTSSQPHLCRRPAALAPPLPSIQNPASSIITPPSTKHQGLRTKDSARFPRSSTFCIHHSSLIIIHCPNC